MKRPSLKTLAAIAWLFALSGTASIARAGVPGNRAPFVTADVRPKETAPIGPAAPVASDYAAREAAAPQLAQFQGGDGGIYIGGGIVTVLLIVLLIVILL